MRPATPTRGARLSLTLGLALAAMFGLLVGPLLHRVRRDSDRWRAALDGFTLVSVAGLALLHLLPEALTHGGWIAGCLAIVGLAMPTLLERWLKVGGENTGFILVFGLAIHAAIESAALGAAPGDDHAISLGAAIVFHRLPVGLLVFAALSDRGAEQRPLRGWLAIGVLVLATLIGFVAGESLAGVATEAENAWLSALVAGALLHVAFSHEIPDGRGRSHGHSECETDHDHEHDHEHEPATPAPIVPVHTHHASADSVWGAIGGVLGVGVVLLAMGAHHDHHAPGAALSFADTLLVLALQTAPFLLLAYLAAALVAARTERAGLRWLTGGSSASQALKGALFVLPMPLYACGVVPLHRALVRRGVPPAAALGVLAAAPLLGLEALLISLPLLGVELTLARLLGGLALAGLAGWLAGSLASRALAHPEAQEGPVLGGRSVREGMRYGLVDLFDHTMPWIACGLVIAALAEPLLGHDVLAGLPAAAQVPIFALVGLPIFVSAAGATPIVAMAIHQGVSPGAGLAFLLAGPVLRLGLFGVLGELHGRRATLAFTAVVLLVACGMGWAVDAVGPEVLGDLHTQVPDTHAPADAHQGHSHGHGHGDWLQWSCLGALGLLLMGSLFRQGPRGVLEQITRPVH